MLRIRGPCGFAILGLGGVTYTRVSLGSDSTLEPGLFTEEQRPIQGTSAIVT